MTSHVTRIQTDTKTISGLKQRNVITFQWFNVRLCTVRVSRDFDPRRGGEGRFSPFSFFFLFSISITPSEKIEKKTTLVQRYPCACPPPEFSPSEYTVTEIFRRGPQNPSVQQSRDCPNVLGMSTRCYSVE